MSRTRYQIRMPVAAVAFLLTVAFVCAQGATATTKGFIWKLERDGRMGWLVGSLHVLTPDYYPLPDTMNNAFLRSVTLVEEVDHKELTSPEAAGFLLSKAAYPKDQTLETQVSKETYEVIVSRLARAGLPVEPFQRMKPWMIALTLFGLEMKRGGFEPALGLDKHFYDKASQMGKTFRGLETAFEQIDHIDALGPELQESLLRESLEGADAVLTQVKAIAEAWRAGNTATIEQILLGTMKDAPRIYQSLIVDRNRRWLPKIEAYLETGHCFVVVGAAHLVGPQGLVTLLRQRGYSVVQQ